MNKKFLFLEKLVFWLNVALTISALFLIILDGYKFYIILIVLANWALFSAGRILDKFLK